MDGTCKALFIQPLSRRYANGGGGWLKTLTAAEPARR